MLPKHRVVCLRIRKAGPVGFSVPVLVPNAGLADGLSGFRGALHGIYRDGAATGDVVGVGCLEF